MTSLVNENYSVMHTITQTEKACRETYEKTIALEQMLKSPKTDLLEMRKLLKEYETQLAQLRTHNKQQFMIAVILIFIIFLGYMLYVLFTNENISDK
uniref:Uncharacterized protein LOC114338502 n=1 Tax=Diabrotica virgifera virgifera TaxID=50390 RepID=A0A6P7GIA3_DIAVI